MKPSSPVRKGILPAILILAIFPTPGCAAKDPAKADPSATVNSNQMVAEPAPSPEVQPLPAPPAEPGGVTWTALKATSFEQREQFFAGLLGLEAQLDTQIGELNAQRAAMEGTADTQNWDFAMKALDTARIYFKSVGMEVRNANSSNWDQLKDKVGRAWTSAQDAVGGVKSSTTV